MWKTRFYEDLINGTPTLFSLFKLNEAYSLNTGALSELGGNRTHTVFLPTDFKSVASACSATSP